MSKDGFCYLSVEKEKKKLQVVWCAWFPLLAFVILWTCEKLLSVVAWVFYFEALHNPPFIEADHSQSINYVKCQIKGFTRHKLGHAGLKAICITHIFTQLLIRSVLKGNMMIMNLFCILRERLRSHKVWNWVYNW